MKHPERAPSATEGLELMGRRSFSSLHKVTHELLAELGPDPKALSGQHCFLAITSHS